MTTYPELFASLSADFGSREVKTRKQGNRDLPYVTARTVMNRLDAVLGPENWWDKYSPREHSVTCDLTIRLPDGSTLTKSDCGGNAGMADEGDDDKSGFADAFKRAAVKFGVGRYLYGDGVPSYSRSGTREPGDDDEPAPVSAPRRPVAAPAPAPAPATNGRGGKPRSEWGSAGHGEETRRRDGDAPRSGRALFAWTKDQDEKFDYGLLKHLNGWAKRQGFAERMVDWGAADVTAAHAEALKRIAALRESEEFQAAIGAH